MDGWAAQRPHIFDHKVKAMDISCFIAGGSANDLYKTFQTIPFVASFFGACLDTSEIYLLIFFFIFFSRKHFYSSIHSASILCTSVCRFQWCFYEGCSWICTVLAFCRDALYIYMMMALKKKQIKNSIKLLSSSSLFFIVVSADNTEKSPLTFSISKDNGLLVSLSFIRTCA